MIVCLIFLIFVYDNLLYLEFILSLNRDPPSLLVEYGSQVKFRCSLAVEVHTFASDNNLNFSPEHISVNVLGPSSVDKIINTNNRARVKADGFSQAFRDMFQSDDTQHGPTLPKAVFGVATNTSGHEIPWATTCQQYNRCSVDFIDLQERKEISVSTRECGSLIDSPRCLPALNQATNVRSASAPSYPYHVLSFDFSINFLEPKHAGQWTAFFYSYYFLFDPLTTVFLRYSSHYDYEADFIDSINTTQFLVVGMSHRLFVICYSIYSFFHKFVSIFGGS